jgi:hypothetical protein
MFMTIFQRLHLNINKYYITHTGMTFCSIVIIILYIIHFNEKLTNQLFLELYYNNSIKSIKILLQ